MRLSKPSKAIHPFAAMAACVGLFCAILAVPAFAQMQDSTIYTDTWGDPDYLYGCGVTDSSYNYYGHTFRSVSTMTSPNG